MPGALVPCCQMDVVCLSVLLNYIDQEHREARATDEQVWQMV